MRKRIRLKADEAINYIIIIFFILIISITVVIGYFLDKTFLLFIGILLVTIGLSTLMIILIDEINRDKKIK
jgi:hypothetical protein